MPPTQPSNLRFCVGGCYPHQMRQIGTQNSTDKTSNQVAFICLSSDGMCPSGTSPPSFTKKTHHTKSQPSGHHWQMICMIWVTVLVVITSQHFTAVATSQICHSPYPEGILLPGFHLFLMYWLVFGLGHSCAGQGTICHSKHETRVSSMQDKCLKPWTTSLVPLSLN